MLAALGFVVLAGDWFSGWCVLPCAWQAAKARLRRGRSETPLADEVEAWLRDQVPHDH